MTTEPIRLAVLLSGTGRTLVNLHERIAAGMLNARIEVVVSSRADVLGVTRARELGLRTTVVSRKGLTREPFQEGISAAVAGTDLVCMAGFLFLWHIPREWTNR